MMRLITKKIFDIYTIHYLLPQDLINTSGMIMYFKKWEECFKHLKIAIPKLKFLNQYRNIQTDSCCCKCVTHKYPNKQN